MGTESAQQLHSRLKWTTKVRPMAVGAYLADLLAPNRRRIVTTKSGLKFWIDPLANLGEEIIKCGEYEPETEQIFRRILRPGDSFLDIGANEGYFTTVAANIVGTSGSVTAVEPQGKICPIIRKNLELNHLTATVVHGAVGGPKGQECELFLYPSLNTGATSIVRRPRLYRHIEKSPFIDSQDLLGSRDRFDLVKVDVEGFEGNVVRSLEPLLRTGSIRTLVLDYHGPILAKNGVNPKEIERDILCTGMRLSGSLTGYQGYRMYERKA